MKHYITNTLLVILTVVGIILGAFGSEILYSLAAFRCPSLLTLIVGLLLAWASAVALIHHNTDWLETYGGK